MKASIFSIESNIKIANDVYKMILTGDTSDVTKPGQFINIAIDGLYLRRPISVSDFEENKITIIYKVVGKGTEIMSRMSRGDKLDILTGLGNGFDVSKCQGRTLLVGGGVGVPPRY